MSGRIAAIGAGLAVVAALSGCAGSGRQAATREPSATRLPDMAKVLAEPMDMPVASGCSVQVHQPFPPDAAESKPDTAPDPITKVPPEYPDAARSEHIQGTVQFRVLVCEHGRVVRARLVKSAPELDGAAAEALVQWSFKPAQRGGQAVAAWIDVPFRFTLN